MSRKNNITEASAAAHYLLARDAVAWTTAPYAPDLSDTARLAAAQVHALIAIYERLDLMHDTLGEVAR